MNQVPAEDATEEMNGPYVKYFKKHTDSTYSGLNQFTQILEDHWRSACWLTGHETESTRS